MFFFVKTPRIWYQCRCDDEMVWAGLSFYCYRELWLATHSNRLIMLSNLRSKNGLTRLASDCLSIGRKLIKNIKLYKPFCNRLGGNCLNFWVWIFNLKLCDSIGHAFAIDSTWNDPNQRRWFKTTFENMRKRLVEAEINRKPVTKIISNHYLNGNCVCAVAQLSEIKKQFHRYTAVCVRDIKCLKCSVSRRTHATTRHMLQTDRIYLNCCITLWTSWQRIAECTNTTGDRIDGEYMGGRNWESIRNWKLRRRMTQLIQSRRDGRS